MKKLVKFYWDCGRQGSVQSIFVTTDEELSTIVGTTICFGEVCGKHSDITGNIEVGDFTTISLDQDFIGKIVDVFGSDTISGHNPFHYLEN